jgi:two-component system NtrC family sensor kinase
MVHAAVYPPGERVKKQFRLVRYFTVASVGMFVAVAAALAYFEHQQASFMATVRREEVAYLQQVQEAFSRQQDRAAREDLVAGQERANLDLTRLFVNTLWEREVAPFMARVAAVPVDHCRALPDPPGGTRTAGRLVPRYLRPGAPWRPADPAAASPA